MSSIYTCNECKDAALNRFLGGMRTNGLVTINKEEAKILVQELMHSFISIDNQKIISQLILRLEKELES